MGVRILYFGGSFNPIHHGHLICARSAAERGGFETVVLIPSRQPPHKPGITDLADASDRLEMCRRACATGFEVSDVELRRTGPSYTLDTARELSRTTGGGKIAWLIGADMLNFLPKWHRPTELLQEVHFVIMARPGWQFDWNNLPSDYRVLEQNVVQTPLIDISSTEIRRRIGRGLSIDYLTPPAVVEYIRSRKLYV